MKRWISFIEASVLQMAGLRLLSGLIEISAAITMLIFNDVKKALVVNSLLAIVGPLVLVATMTIGVINIAGDISMGKLLFIALGVGFILVGIYK